MVVKEKHISKFACCWSNCFAWGSLPELCISLVWKNVFFSDYSLYTILSKKLSLDLLSAAYEWKSESHSAVSDSLWLHGLHFPGQNTGVGSHSPLQRIFPTQGPNPDLPHCRQILYYLSHKRCLHSFNCAILCSDYFPFVFHT